MAYPFSVNQSTLGVTLGNADGATAKFTLGMRVQGSSDTEWEYVRAGVALLTGTVVQVGASFTAALINVAYAGKELAFSQGVFSANDYGFVARRGNGIYVRITGPATAGKPVYPLSVSGLLRRAAATGTILGVSLVASTAITRRAVTAYVNWPRGILM